jgi:hypothetical protein
MTTQIESDALLEAIERRLSEISDSQHSLAVQKSHLIEQLTPLRLGVASPAAAVAQLRSKGIALRGWDAAVSASRRPRPVVLRAVVSRRPRASLPAARSDTA